MRTSSRLGYLDMGVNAKRYQWFSERLGGTTGWKTSPLTSKAHEQYFSLNGVTDKDVRAGSANAMVTKTEKVRL